MSGPTKTKPKAVTIKADDLKSGKLTASNDDIVNAIVANTAVLTVVKNQLNLLLKVNGLPEL